MKSSKSKIGEIILIILSIIASLQPLLYFFTVQGNYIVELTGLPEVYHLLLFAGYIPQVLLIFCALIFPILFSPIFIAIKKVLMRRYENVHVKYEENSLKFWEFFKRGFKVSILVISLFSLIANSNFDASILATNAKGDFGSEIIFSSGVSLQIVNLLASFALGIWSIGWVLEDAGLMHYKLSSDESKGYFEIEPAFMRYNAIVEGYSGISTIIFFFKAVSIAISHGNLGDIIYTVGMAFATILICSLGYLIYWKVTRPFMIKRLQKGLKEVEKLTEVKFKEENRES